ncbi:ArsR/SmtB family transcription factor, partial [Pyramidobacter porci]
RVFWLLCHGEECVINISALMEMSSPAVSHHLRLLKAAGLIVSRREGKEVYYRAAASDTAAMLHRAIEELMSMVCPCARLRRRGGNG